MRIRVLAIGGPLDGQEFLTDDHALAVMNVAPLYPLTAGDSPNAMPITDEPYVVGYLEAPSEALQGDWFVVWAPIVQPQIRELLRQRDEQGPDTEQVERMRAAHKAVDPQSKLAMEPCRPGTHHWTGWELTPRGGRVRSCKECGIGQGSFA